MFKKVIMAKSNNGGGGAASGGLVTLLQAAFIICKILKANVIGKWPWWKVMLPIICTTGLLVLIFCCIGTAGACIVCCESRKKNKGPVLPVEKGVPVEQLTVVTVKEGGIDANY